MHNTQCPIRYVFGGEGLEPSVPVDSKVYACDLSAQPTKR
jgi:hypothetical protein